MSDETKPSTTERLLAVILVQLVRLQTRKLIDHIEILRNAGLGVQEIAAALGTTEAVINVTRSRAHKKRKRQ